MSNRIILVGNGREEQEFDANAAITPGDLIEFLSSGKVQRHSVEGGLAERFFATEDALQGNSIDDDYASDDKVFSTFAMPGDEINARIKASTTVAVGDVLVSASGGVLIPD